MKTRCFVCLIVLAGYFFFVPTRGFSETLSGEAAFVPWSGFWWPRSSGKLIFGYNGHPSPLEKYDLFTSAYYPANATRWEIENVFASSALSWAGYCHAWANASILEDIDFSASVHRGIFFAVGDKKGLMTLCHAEDPQVLANCMDDPSVFHRYLLEYIGEGGLSIVADLNSTEAVWSYPVYRYEMDLTPRNLFEDGVLVAVDDITCKIYYAGDFVDPDFEGTDVKISIYSYRLYKDGNGSYTHGEWTGSLSENHPEWVWIPVSQQAKNPYLDYDTIREISLSQDDETEGDINLVPGHYPLIVYPGEEDCFSVDLPAQSSINFSIALDSQNPLTSTAGYALTCAGETIFSGEITDSSQSFSVDHTDACAYQFIVQPGDSNETGVFIRFYWDIIFAENAYLLDIKNNYYWMGLGIGNYNYSDTNRYYITYMTEAGFPLGSVPGASHIDGNANWTGVLERDLPFDYFSEGEPSIVRITSEYPLSILEIIGDENALSGPPIEYASWSGEERTWVIPLLTRMFGSIQNSKMFFYNPHGEEISGQVEYYSAGGDFNGEEEWAVPANGFQTYHSGFYPGNRDIAGWGVISDPSGRLLGKVEIDTGVDKRDELPLLETGTTFWLPNIASEDGWETRLHLFNVSDYGTDVTLTCINGEHENKTIVVSHAAHEKQELVMDGLFWEMSEDEASASWVLINASSPIAGFISHGYSDVSLASFPLFTEELFSSTKRLCHVASDDVWWTGIVLLNTDTASVELNFMGYDSDGNEVAGTTRSIDGMKKMTTLVRWLFPDEPDMVKSLRIEATMPVIGYVVYGNHGDFDLLSGVVLE